MSKEPYFCPFDGKTKVIRIPDNNISQVYTAEDLSNPSKTVKFCKCKTLEVSYYESNLKNYIETNFFYKIDDIWEFDNVGVSKPPPGLKNPEVLRLKNCENDCVTNFAIVKYLVCGDCDKGALGFGGIEITNENKSDANYNLFSIDPTALTYFFYI